MTLPGTIIIFDDRVILVISAKPWTRWLDDTMMIDTLELHDDGKLKKLHLKEVMFNEYSGSS